MPITAAVCVMCDVVAVVARAMPKSITLTEPSRQSITFAGLMSRWMIPIRWL